MSSPINSTTQEVSSKETVVETKIPPEVTDLSGNDAATDEREAKQWRERWQSGKSAAMITTQNSTKSDGSFPTDQVENEDEAGTFKRFRDFCGACVNNERVQNFILLLIIINAIMMGLGTFGFVTKDPEVTAAFELTDMVFLIVFTVELSFHFAYRGFSLFTDGWLVFDFVIIVMSWSLATLRIVRTFRIFRALRLVTRVAILRNLVHALFSVGPRIFGIGALLMLIFYIYAVMCTILFKDLYANGHLDHDYFSRLDRSFWTLFVMMTLDWTNVSRQVMDVYPLSWMIFVSFVMISSFIVYNLVVAVVCDSVKLIEAANKEESLGKPGQEETSFLELVRNLNGRVDLLATEQTRVLDALLVALQQASIESPLMPGLSKNLPKTENKWRYDGDKDIPTLMTPSKKDVADK